LVASYDLQPGNGAGPIFWKVRDRRRNRREGKTRILHRTYLIIFPLTLQTITTAPMMSI